MVVHRAVDFVIVEARGSCLWAVAYATFCVARGTGSFFFNCTDVVLPNADARTGPYVGRTRGCWRFQY